MQNGITLLPTQKHNYAMTDIDVLLQENRKFEPGDEFKSQAHITSADIYAEAAADPEAYWEKMAGELEWIAQMGPRSRLEAAACRMVRRRQAQCRGELRRPPCPQPSPQQGSVHLGRRAGRPPNSDLLGSAVRSERVLRTSCASSA